MEQPLAFVVGFRQYLGYHLDAVKITMHTRMRAKTDTIENMIRQARKDEEESKVYKATDGGLKTEGGGAKGSNEEVFKVNK